MDYNRDLKDKSNEDLITRLDHSFYQRETDKEQIQMTLIMRFTQQINQTLTTLTTNMGRLNTSIKKYSLQNDRLSKRIFWLNIILTAATILGVFATLTMAFRNFFQ